jgi:hypothetical protein
MNLTALLADCYTRLREPPSPAATTVARLTSFVNEVQRELLADPDIARLRDDVLPVTAYANRARSGLPPSVARINKLVDRANNLPLKQVPLSDLRLTDPGQTYTGGYPLRYSVIGQQAVAAQPTTVGSGLWVVSSSATDVGRKAYLETQVLGGYPNQTLTAGTTLNGTTRVAVGTRTDHVLVEKFYLDLAAPAGSTAAAGFISLYDAAVSGTELARIPLPNTFSRYLAVEWWPIPTVDVIETADVTRTIFDLVNGTDEPLLPPDFHYVLLAGVRMKAYEVLDDNRVARARADYEVGKSALRSWVLTNGDRIASLRPTRVRWNNLGYMYPMDRS